MPRTALPDPDRLLAEHDIPCPACGHSLRGIEINLCPECGAPFDRQSFAFVSPELGVWSIFRTRAALIALFLLNLGCGAQLLDEFLVAGGGVLTTMLIVVRAAVLMGFFAAGFACLGHVWDLPRDSGHRDNDTAGHEFPIRPEHPSAPRNDVHSFAAAWILTVLQLVTMLAQILT